MSIRRKIRKDGKRTKVRRDAKLLNLPEKDRKLVVKWALDDGESLCLQRIASQLHIQCSKTTLYAALAFWDSEQENDRARAMAFAQLRQEEASKDMTPAQFMAALDRRMAMLKAAKQDDDGYNDARYLIIADESARAKKELEDAKLEIARLKLVEKAKDRALVERRVKVLENNQAKAVEKLQQVKAAGGITKETRKLIEDAMAGLSA